MISLILLSFKFFKSESLWDNQNKCRLSFTPYIVSLFLGSYIFDN